MSSVSNNQRPTELGLVVLTIQYLGCWVTEEDPVSKQQTNTPGREEGKEKGKFPQMRSRKGATCP